MTDTNALRRLYRRASFYYDILDWPMERFRYRHIRPVLWEGLRGRILDLGAGTGRNVAYYPNEADVVTADLSPEMLKHARRRLESSGRRPQIAATDATKMIFSDGEFDACVSTFLFCVLPNELQSRALKEVKRVLKPGGKVYLLEYVYSKNPWRRLWMRAMAPLVEWLFGARFDRRTREHLPETGFKLVEARFVFSDVIVLLVGEV